MKRKLAKYFRLSQEDVEMRSNSLKDESNSIHSQRLLCDSFIDKHADLQQMQSEEFIDAAVIIGLKTIRLKKFQKHGAF